jgi:hypothetical protein
MNDLVTYDEILSPERIRAGIEHYAEKPNPYPLPDGAKGAIIGALNRAISATLSGRPDKKAEPEEIDWCRHLITGYLCLPLSEPLREMSSKELTDGQWIGFSRWHSERVDNGQGEKAYQERPTFAAEVAWVLYRARHDHHAGMGILSLYGLYIQWEDENPEEDHWDIENFIQNVKLTIQAMPQGAKLINEMEKKNDTD